jgi:hypothetical protein
MYESFSARTYSRRRAQSVFEQRSRVNTRPSISFVSELLSVHASSAERPENVSSSNMNDCHRISESQRRFMFICEPIVAGVFILPLLVIFWQSSWNLILEWVNRFPEQQREILSGLHILSQTIFLCMYINQNRLYDYVVHKKSHYIIGFIRQSYVFILAFNGILQWTTMWTIWDFYTYNDWLLMLLSSIIAILAMVVLTGNPGDLVCAPFILSYDSIEYNIRIDTSLVVDKVNSRTAAGRLDSIMLFIFR